MGSGLREWAGRLALVAVSLGFADGALESLALLRLVDYRLVLRTLGDEPWRNPLNILDPELLHLHRPGSRLQGVTPTGDIAFYMNVSSPNPYPYDAKYDSKGFRNDRDLEAAQIAVIGDSFIEAYTVPAEQALASELGRLSGAQVANLGQLWYGPQQELAVLRRYALPLGPKTIVWAFFGGNDLSDFRRYAEAKASWEAISPTFHSFPQRSFAKNALRFAARLVRKPPAKIDAVIGSCPNGAGGRADLYFYYPETPLDAKDEETLGKVTEVLAEAHRLSRAAGARLVVAYVPTKFQVYRELCEFAPDSRASREWTARRGLSGRLKDALSSISPEIGYVDLGPALTAASRAGRPTYFQDDTHWTAEGNAVAARAIHEYLSSEKVGEMHDRRAKHRSGPREASLAKDARADERGEIRD